uniref:Centromere protein K n=1 Tax=Lepisosteus oculatus TaxID=7918 RepID=W5NKH0_LEPOC
QWKKLEQVQEKISLVGAEALQDTEKQLSISQVLQAKALSAELKKWADREPELLPKNHKVLVAVGMEELQRVNRELEMVLSCCQAKNEKLKHDVKRAVQETKRKIQKIKAYQENLLETFSDFLAEHFPIPQQQANENRKKKVFSLEPTVELISLHDILELLMNKLFESPHDPYITIDETFWPPYTEMLLRHGIALRHPEDSSKIRLEAFHQ